MSEDAGKNMPRPRPWTNDKSFETWKREIRMWELSTGVSPERRAAMVAHECLSGHRQTLAFDWIEQDEDRAKAAGGLNALLAYLESKTQGETRDKRMNAVFELLRHSRTVGTHIQNYLNELEHLFTKVRKTGLEICPEPKVSAGSIHQVTLDGRTVLSITDEAISEGWTMAKLEQRLADCDKYEVQWQNLMATLMLQAAHLPFQDEKILLSKLSENEWTTSNLEKELRRMYPLKPDGRNSAGSRDRHGKRQALMGELEWEQEAPEDGEWPEYEDELEYEDESSGEEVQGVDCPEAFRVVVSRRTGKMGVRPRRGPKGRPGFSKGSRKGGKGGQGKGSHFAQNSPDPKTGSARACFRCGSTSHFIANCPQKAKGKGGKKGRAHVAEDEPENAPADQGKE